MNPPSVVKVFHYVRRRAAEIDPSLREVRLELCAEADDEHRKSDRQYAHWGHKPDTICVARAIEDLDAPWKLGLIAHEFGHAIAVRKAGDAHTEDDAHRLGGMIIGAPVVLKGPLKLEWAPLPAGEFIE